MNRDRGSGLDRYMDAPRLLLSSARAGGVVIHCIPAFLASSRFWILVIEKEGVD